MQNQSTPNASNQTDEEYKESPSSNNETDMSAELSDLSREFYNFLADIEDLFKATTSLTDEDLAEANAKLHSRIQAGKNWLANIRAAASETAAKSDSYVQEHPAVAIGVSAAAGFLLGLYIARRK